MDVQIPSRSLRSQNTPRLPYETSVYDVERRRRRGPNPWTGNLQLLRKPVMESRTSAGNLVAVKVKPREIKKAISLEALMLKYASEQPSLLVPRYRECYRVGKYHIVIVTDLVRGVSLDKAWHSMTKEQCDSIKTPTQGASAAFSTLYTTLYRTDWPSRDIELLRKTWYRI